MCPKTMDTPKKYFHDYLVLSLLSANIMLALISSIYLTIRIILSHHGLAYYIEYRSPLGLNFKTGSLLDIFSFVVFILLTLVIDITLSLRTYYIHRQLTVTILSMGILLILMTCIVSNALLVLR